MPYAATVTPTELQTFLDNPDIPVLINFTADWCGPCKGMAPHLEAFATERELALKVVKVNIDEHPQESARFKVRSVPTLILLKVGQVKGVQVGAMTKAQLSRFVDSNLGD
jgi:thioredoxin 1